jgi:replicative DNA helicase
LMEGARRIYERKECLGIDETPGISLMELRSRCRRYHKEYGLDMIIIDYLQLMSGGEGKSESREREISEISMGLKSLAKELRVPVVALAQLNRGPDARPDKRPKISDLRESGSMEQDADMIFFIYRDEYYNPSSELAGIAELMIAKNRHGATKVVKLAYQPHYVSFQNLFQEGAVADLDE